MSEINLESLESITIDDFKQMCRLCLSRTNLTQLNNNQETINMLQFFTQLQFDVIDDSPAQICQNCIRKTAETYNFINICKIVDETYKKCLDQASQLKTETIFLESGIKEEFIEMEIKQENEPHETLEIENVDCGTFEDEENTLMEFVRLGKNSGCDSLIMRYFTERTGAERLSMHFFLTSVKNTCLADNYTGFMDLIRREMTVDLCAIASEKTSRRNSELGLELRYGRITSSKIYMVSCCEFPDEYFIENVIGFHKINETKITKRNQLVEQKIEKQLNVKINKRGLILNPNYPEFVAKVDGVTEDAVIKMKYLKNRNDYLKYIDADKNLTPKTKTEMHLLMLMTDLRTGYLCVIDPNFANTNTIVKVDYNERYFAEVLRKSQAFWMTKIYPALVKTVTL